MSNTTVTRSLTDEQYHSVGCCWGKNAELSLQVCKNGAPYASISVQVSKLGNKLLVFLGHVDAHGMSQDLERLIDALLRDADFTLVNHNGTYLFDCALGQFAKFRRQVRSDEIKPFLGATVASPKIGPKLVSV